MVVMTVRMTVRVESGPPKMAAKIEVQDLCSEIAQNHVNMDEST